jgi:phosphotransferase system, enzyme I, PtsP
VTLCGELASQPIGALALAAIGYRALSLTPSAVGPVKALLLDLDCRKAAAFLRPLIDKPSGGAPIREQLKAFAAREALQI